MNNAQFTKHFTYYIILISILLLGTFLAINLSFNKQLQMMAIVLTALLYAGGGIFHHALHHDLSTKIVVEYVLMGSLGITIVAFLLKGSLL